MTSAAKRIKLIGLTGGVASGKSTVVKMFHRLGVPTIDTDKLAHYLMRKGTKEYQKIVKIFGRTILKKNGEINRQRLAEVVFRNNREGKSSRRQLEKILHPSIWKIVEIVAAKFTLPNTHPKRSRGVALLCCNFLVIEVPLLFEVGWDKKVDCVIVVTCSRDEMFKRCKERFKNRIEFQIPLSKKVLKADFVINSSFGRSNTFKQVKSLTSLLMSK